MIPLTVLDTRVARAESGTPASLHQIYATFFQVAERIDSSPLKSPFRCSYEESIPASEDARKTCDVHHPTDGCGDVAALPSEKLALEGDLTIAVGRSPGGTQVEAKTEIPGQMLDWGKSTRCLESLLSELTIVPAA